MGRKLKRQFHKWTPEEDAYLEKWVGRKTDEQIGKHLHRTKWSVRKRRAVIGLTIFKLMPWNEKEIQQLKALHGVIPEEEIAERIGRSHGAVSQKVSKLKLSCEKKISYNARGQKVQRINGIRLYWSPQMLDDFKRLFPITKNEDLVEYLGVSQRTIARKARELGLQKDPVLFRKWTDEARRRARLVNITQGNSGMFKKGHRASPNTEFKPGVNNRKVLLERKLQKLKENEAERTCLPGESDTIC